MYFQYIPFMATPQHKNTDPRSHEIYIFSRPFLSHHNQALSSSESCLEVEKKILKEIMQFHYMTYMAMPQQRTPADCPRGHEIYNFGRHFLDHHTCILTLSVLCLGEEKKIFKEIMHFHYMIYMATPQHKNPCPKGHEIYNLGKPFLGHHCYALIVNHAWEQSRFTSIFHFLPQNSLSLGREVMIEICNFQSPYRNNATHQIWSRLVLQFLRC